MVSERTLQFIGKAEKWLRWCDTLVEELNEYGKALRMDDVERVFTGLLSSVTTVHESLTAAANSADLKDWSGALNGIRNTDEVLLYIWKARDSETHDALVKWSPDIIGSSLRIVDTRAAFQTGAMFFRDRSPAAVNARLLRYVYESTDDEELTARIRSHFHPSEERLRQAGVLFMPFDSLELKDFWARDNKGKRIHIKAPKKHLGKRIPETAHHVIEAATRFYRQKYQELTATLGLPDALGWRLPLVPRP